MKHEELKEAIFDIFRKKNLSNEPQTPKFESLRSILSGKMNLSADDFAQLNPNTPVEDIIAGLRTAYLRGDDASRASLRTLLDKEPYSGLGLEDKFDEIDAARGTANTNLNRQFGASNQPTVTRSDSGFLREEQLRMQMLAGIITESEYKTKLNEINLKSLATGAALGLSTLLPSTGLSQTSLDKEQDSIETYYNQEKYADEILNGTPKVLNTAILNGQGKVIKQIEGRELSMDDFKDRNVSSDFMLMRTAQYGDNTHEFIIFPKQKPSKSNPDEWKRVGYEIYIDGYLVKDNQVRKKIESTIFSDMYKFGEFLGKERANN